MSDDLARLLQSYRSRTPGAADELAARALRIGLRTATAMLGDREQAADVAQETAVEVLRGVDRVRDPLALDAWIQRIAARRTMRLIRKNRARATREVPLEPLTDVLEFTGPEGPHDVAERREMAAAMRSAISLLPVKQQMALTLRYGHDLSYEQIAEAMGTRPGTVGALISRAQATLRSVEQIERFADDERGGDA
jgi:RNA polymerase sigma factor (sigma-70 family)